MTTTEAFYTIGFALCLFSTALFRREANVAGSPKLQWLSVYLGLEAVCFAFELLIVHPGTPLKAMWLAMLLMASLAVGPVLWLAIKERIEGKRAELIHLSHWERAAVLAGWLFTVPLISASHLGVTFDQPVGTTSVLLPFIHETMLLCIGIFAVQVPVYVWRCRALLMQWSDRKRWALAALCTVSLTWVFGIVRTLWVALTDADQTWFSWLSGIEVSATVVAVYTIIRSTGLPHAAMMRAHTSSDDAKYAKSQVDAAVRARVLRKLDQASQQGCFLDSSLSLSSLSLQLKESEHYVSQVINQALGITFYEWLNSQRVDYAKRLLLESPDRPILEIALAAGFNAKSTFNSAFKRITGLTPRDFRLRDVNDCPPRQSDGLRTS